MSFHVGQKVVCVDVEPIPGRFWEDRCPLKLGAVYTIHAFAPSPHDGKPCVFLKEVKRRIGWPFGVFRFRPAVEPKRKTDISIFKKLLVTSKQPMNVE